MAATTAPAPKPKAQKSDLAVKEERLAYGLLVPTFLILITIAFYPLGSVFINSLTNREFASAQEQEFIGIENYRNLLSLTIRELPPEIDAETGQQISFEIVLGYTGELAWIEDPFMSSHVPRDPVVSSGPGHRAVLFNRELDDAPNVGCTFAGGVLDRVLGELRAGREEGNDSG